MRKFALLAAIAASAVAAKAQAGIFITEWMYSGDEFIEFTNTGPAAVNLATYSFDDDSRTPGVVSLASLGTLAPGESALITETDAATFRTTWGLSASVKILGGNTTNLGRNDEINIYDGATLVDRLTYGDQSFAGTIRTQNISGNVPFSALGANTIGSAVLSVDGDIYGSYTVFGAFTANPGSYAPVVPEPAAAGLAGVAGLGLLARRRRA